MACSQAIPRMLTHKHARAWPAGWHKRRGMARVPLVCNAEGFSALMRAGVRAAVSFSACVSAHTQRARAM